MNDSCCNNELLLQLLSRSRSQSHILTLMSIVLLFMGCLLALVSFENHKNRNKNTLRI